MYCNVSIYIENLENQKYHIFLKKHLVFLLFTVILVMNIKKYSKKNNQLKY